MDNADKNNLEFHNKINPGYRQIHADGILGGITPKGLININFFSERFPIPKSTFYEFIAEKKLIKEIKHSDDSKEGIIREFEFGVYLEINAAKELSNWLLDKINEYETIKSKNER